MAHALHRTVPGLLKRWARLLAMAILNLALWALAGNSPAIQVPVNGRTVTVFESTTLAQALRRAGVTVTDGVLYSAGTHKILNRHASPPTVTVNGRPAGRSTRLHSGSVVVATSGIDAVEEVQANLVTIPAGLPDVERVLWNPGRAGRDVITVGKQSGEIVSRQSVVAMIPAAPDTRRLVALSFDDGPDPRFTPQVLSILSTQGIRATFCLVGRQMRKRPDLVAAIAAGGHVMCSHGESHSMNLKALPRQRIDQEVGSASFFTGTITGARPDFFRAPGGSLNGKVIQAAHARGMRVLGWSVDPRDFEKPSPAAIQLRIMSSVQPGSIVLMHDGGGDRSSTVAALPGLIQQLKAAGYGFSTP